MGAQGPRGRPGGALPFLDVELSLAGRRIHHSRPRTGHGNPRLPLPEGRTPPPQRFGLQAGARLRLLRGPPQHPRISRLDIQLEGVHAFASLSPVKEKELVVIGSEPGDESLSHAVGALLQGYVEDLVVRAFNVAFYMPPLGSTQEDWSDFPTVVYIVDRGDPSNRTSDIGAMELYAASVVTSDPFRVAVALRERGSGSTVGAARPAGTE